MKKNISKLPACLVFDEKIFLTMITFCSPSAYIFILYRGMKTYIRSRTIFAKLTFCEKFLLFLIRELKYIFGKLKVLKCTRCQICALWRSRLGNCLACKRFMVQSPVSEQCSIIVRVDQICKISLVLDIYTVELM